ncbi:beta-fructofuranosidase [Quercus suber]|uniref:Beta-fructofuranosidase n=1 Tax=Quercus suber TaxID=58331 RepID=A0AAW0K2I3_QUESU
MDMAKFLPVLLCLFSLCVAVQASHKVYPEFQSLHSEKTSQSIETLNLIQRTGYHFQPPRHWINGPMYYNGLYHLFYQYNPKGAVWGNIVWAHSVSKDLINWEPLEPAIYPTDHFDINGCWSGSATILPGNKPVILYTGIDPKNRQVSLDLTRYEYYTVGQYHQGIDRYVPDNTSVDGWSGLRYDYGNFYASKTFFDVDKNRRILWGWANESDIAQHDVAKGWAGIQTIPRELWLDSSGKQLIQWPIEELETLRGDKADVDVTFLLPSSLDSAEQFDPSWVNAQDVCALKGIKVEGGVGPFGLFTLASENLKEYTPVFFRIFKAPQKHVVLMCSDARRLIILLWKVLELEEKPASHQGFILHSQASMMLTCSHLITGKRVLP